MKKSLILPILFLFILLTTSLVGAIGEQRMLWASSDTHVRVPGIWSRGGEYYYMMVNDTNNNISTPDVYINAGDNVDLGSTWQNWDLFHLIFNTTQYVTFRNYTIGNHDHPRVDWQKYAFGGPSHENWTFTYGNILFITVSMGSNIPGDYRPSYVFLNETVQANQDKNIIVFSHHPLENTTNSTWYGGDTMSLTKGGDDCNWLCRNYNISMWFAGHCSLPGNYTQTTKFIYGTLFANVGSACLTLDGDIAANYLANWHSTKQVDSLFVNFTKGSTNVTLQRRNHNTSSWYTDQYFNVTLDDRWINGSWLDFPFSTGATTISSGPTPGNNSINIPTTMKTISINISNPQNNTMNWTIELSNGNSSFGNLTTNTSIVCYVNLTGSVEYTWWVNSTDDDVIWTNDTYYFTSGGFNSYLEATIHKNTFDDANVGNSVFNMIGLILIIGAILGIVGVVFYINKQ